MSKKRVCVAVLVGFTFLAGLFLVQRQGTGSIGRFFGPLRASVPLAAGIFEMPYWQFQIANFVSAFIWAAALLLFGDVIAQIAEWLWRVV